jgi:hypothetical protein
MRRKITPNKKKRMNPSFSVITKNDARVTALKRLKLFASVGAVAMELTRILRNPNSLGFQRRNN